MKKSKSLAEYAMRKWMESEGLAMEHFKLEMTGSREAVLKDGNGDQMNMFNLSIEEDWRKIKHEIV